MDNQTINQLNLLNQRFYRSIADEFSQTRSKAWVGWQKILPLINLLIDQQQQLRILDIGCGNGRFALFLHEKLGQNFSYWGVDNSPELLKIAATNTNSVQISAQFSQIDLVDSLLTNRPQLSDLKSFNPNLVVLFGVIHHIPSYRLRTILLKQLNQISASNSLMIVTAWQFAEDKQIHHKIIDPKLVGLNPTLLEPHDFILDWQRGQTAYRYCHHFDQTELDQLLIDTNLKLVTSFSADGKSQQLNRYLIIKPKLP